LKLFIFAVHKQTMTQRCLYTLEGCMKLSLPAEEQHVLPGRHYATSALPNLYRLRAVFALLRQQFNHFRFGNFHAKYSYIFSLTLSKSQ
jgi:hypothetical protein